MTNYFIFYSTSFSSTFVYLATLAMGALNIFNMHTVTIARIDITGEVSNVYKKHYHHTVFLLLRK